MALGFFRKTVTVGRGAPFPGMGRALLYHVRVARCSAFIAAAAIAVTTKAESVQNGNIHMYDAQVSC